MHIRVFALLTTAMLVNLQLSSLAADVVKSWTGYLIDQKCMKSVEHDPDPRMFVKYHTKSCLLMPACAESGYVLYTKGTWFRLDKKGNDLAKKIIRSSKKDSEFYIRVKGVKVKDYLVVSEISEATEPGASEEK